MASIYYPYAIKAKCHDPNLSLPLIMWLVDWGEPTKQNLADWVLFFNTRLQRDGLKGALVVEASIINQETDEIVVTYKPITKLWN